MAGKGAPKGRPRPAGSGRQKGTLNKHTTELKELVFAALHADQGAEAWLREQKQDNPVAFMTLLGKFVPRDINANVNLDVNVADVLAQLKAAKNGAS